MERMARGEHRARLDVGDHARAELLREGHPRAPARLGAVVRPARITGAEAPLSNPAARWISSGAGGRLGRSEPRWVGQGWQRVELLLLERGVEVDVDRRAWSR